MKTPQKIVDIVIPTYNEAEIIVESINILYEYCSNNLSNYKYNIVIADNGSTDGTSQLVRDHFRHNATIDLVQIKDKGRGRALLYAWGKSKADICCYMDADLSTDLKHLPILIEKIDKEGYDIAVGSRHLKKSIVKRGIFRRVVGESHILFMKLMLGVSFSDPYCGFKVASKKCIESIFPRINPDRWKQNGNAWIWDTEFLTIGERLGLKIYEDPVHWNDDPTSKARIIEDTIESIKGILRIRREKPWRD